MAIFNASWPRNGNFKAFRIPTAHVGDLTVLTLLQVATACIGFVTRLQLANAMGRSGFGEFVTACSLGSVVAIVCTFGMEKSLIGEYLRLPGHQGEVLAASLRVKLPLFSLSLLGVLFYWSNIVQSDFPIAGLVIVLAVALQAFSLQALYDARHLVRLHALFFVFERSIYFVTLWALFVFDRNGVALHSVAPILLFAVMFGLALQYGYARTFVTTVYRRKYVSARFLMRSNVWTWLAGLCALLIDVITPVVLSMTSGASEVGGFSAGFLIAQAGCLGIGQIARIGSKELAKAVHGTRKQINERRVLHYYTLVVTSAGVCVGIAISLLGPTIISQYTSEFAESLSVLKVLSWYPLAYGICQVYTQYLIFTGRQSLYFRCLLLCGVGSLLISVPACEQYAATGAAVALVFNTAMTGCMLAAVSLGRR